MAVSSQVPVRLEYAAQRTLRLGSHMPLSDRSVAVVLALITVILLFATTDSIGLTWDEPIYIEASESYATWLVDLVQRPAYALSAEDIAQHWQINHEHPPVDKVWSGLVWSIVRPVVDDLTAHRLGNILVAGGLVALIYLTVAAVWGRSAGLVAAAAVLTMPRVFFHAHLASLDLPAAAATFAVCVLFWRTHNRLALSWSIWLGLAFGLAMGTKINALLELPITLGLWVLLFQRGRRMRLIGRLLVMTVVGVAFASLLWPWLYNDTLGRARDYLAFMTLDHYPIEQWYLHRLFAPPPWHYPFVVMIAVVPLATLLLAILGAATVVRRDWTHTLTGLLVLGGLVPMLLLIVGKAQIYDGERLWMPAFPFVAALAGVGFAHLATAVRGAAQRLARPAWASPLLVIIGVAAFLPPVAVARDLYPHLLSYYSETVGGLGGATRMGLETTYWAETYAESLPILNARAPYGAMVWAEAHDVLLYYQAHGLLRSDLRIASNHGAEGIVKDVEGYTVPVEDADLVVVAYRQSGFSGGVTRWLKDGTKIYQLDRQGTPLMAIFTR
jgi:4-amino-4-deoxy-L-arabinose transferase-like glycosyltransferase